MTKLRWQKLQNWPRVGVAVCLAVGMLFVFLAGEVGGGDKGQLIPALDDSSREESQLDSEPWPKPKPQLDSMSQLDSEPWLESDPESQPEVDSASEPDSEPWPQLDPWPQSDPDHQSESVPEPEPETEPEPCFPTAQNIDGAKNADDISAADEEILVAEPTPMYRLPTVAVLKQPPSSASLSAVEPDIGPLPAESAEALLRDMDEVWPEDVEYPSEPWTGAVAPTPYTPTVAALSAQLLPSVRKAYGLAQHGAVYAAETEFIQVLRRVAQAKDATENTEIHSRSLAAGLRALDEADDFMPSGSQLEAEMNVPVIVSSHRTPVLVGRDDARPQEAIALYHHFARQQLAQAVAGEQAGSMALHGLGKVQNRLAREADGELRHERKAMTLFLAALDSGPGNHLAANEIGVLLSRSGQPMEAAAMFRQAIDVAPTSTAYHNLAVVERILGSHAQADANEQYARHLAALERSRAGSRSNGIEWVAPQDLGRVAGPALPTPAPAQLPAPPAAEPVQTVAKWPQKLIPGVFRR